MASTRSATRTKSKTAQQKRKQSSKANVLSTRTKSTTAKAKRTHAARKSPPLTRFTSLQKPQDTEAKTQNLVVKKNKDPYCNRWWNPKDVDDLMFFEYWENGVRPPHPEPVNRPLDNTDNRPVLKSLPLRPDGSVDCDRYEPVERPIRVRRQTTEEAEGQPCKGWLIEH
jgi:hypothetical protein